MPKHACVCVIPQVLQATLKLLIIMTKHSLDLFCQDCPSFLALAEALLIGGYGNLAECGVCSELTARLVYNNFGDVFRFSRRDAAADNLRWAARELLPAAMASLPWKERLKLLQAANEAIEDVFNGASSCQSSNSSGNPFDETPEESENQFLALHKLSAAAQVLSTILSAGTSCVCSGQQLIYQPAFESAVFIVDSWTAVLNDIQLLWHQDLAAMAAMEDAVGVVLAACTLQLLGCAATALGPSRYAGAMRPSIFSLRQSSSWIPEASSAALCISKARFRRR